ncbi:MAG: peptidase S16, partial [Pseudomonadales bacterium]
DAVFKIRADFHDDVKRTPESEHAMVAKIADIAKAKGLLSFNNQAMASIIDHLSLVADEQNRLSLHSDRLSQLLFESNRHAKLANANARQVGKKHVIQAIKDMDERSGYLRDLYWQEIENGQQIINTRGKAIGQINALTVISYADSEFGMPARLTALIQPKAGHGEILDIERDVNLGGSLHAKGMLIQTCYLRSLFSQFHELNFSASLAFEQNYAHIDGDSATLAEACALMSALAKAPINQGIAITGSMNQFGEVQAIGGVNEKITGFYDTCMEQGLIATETATKATASKTTSDQQIQQQVQQQVQGVIIPRSNIHNLMLRDDIIKAVEKGEFAIYAVEHLHEALQILTQMPIDEKNKKGNYRKKSLFGKIAKQLRKWEIIDKENDKEDMTDEKDGDTKGTTKNSDTSPKKKK